MNFQPPAPYFTQIQQIHDAVWTRVQKVTGFASFSRTPMRIVPPGSLPRLSVYIAEDDAAPRGDEAFCGEPEFTHHGTILISAAILEDDVDAQFLALESSCDAIYNLLLTDPTFVGGRHQPIEGISRIRRMTKFENVGETPVAEIQMFWTFRYVTIWPPVIPDQFLRVFFNPDSILVEHGLDPNLRPNIQAQWPIHQKTHHVSATFAGAGLLIDNGP